MKGLLRRLRGFMGLGGLLVAGCFNLPGGSGGLIWSFVATMAFLRAVSSAGIVAIARRADRKLFEVDHGLPGLEGE